MTAICPAGPPNDNKATRTQARVASEKLMGVGEVTGGV
jgi:hypothetical protein